MDGHVRRGDGTARTLRPAHRGRNQRQRHPNIPKIETLENFAGKVLHSSQSRAARNGGPSAVVFGTGTSAHDICQELQAHGAEVTMVQRSPTMVVNVDPSAQLYNQSYLGDGPPIDVRDTLNSGMPLAVIKASHKLITNEVKKLDAALLQRLENVGFRLEFGEDGTGWPLKFRTRGGGYYFNVGCSELIAEKIRLIQATDIKRFTRTD
jgi:cation diffusion facilitator CzcD-associated flavoprotein CzcO